MHKYSLVVIMDDLAQDILGIPQFFKADAQAIRFFGEVASDNRNQVGKYPADHRLVELCTVGEDFTTEHSGRTIITGAQWLAAQQPQQPEPNNGQLSLGEHG